MPEETPAHRVKMAPPVPAITTYTETVEPKKETKPAVRESGGKKPTTQKHKE